ncbi:MAG: hypothetical protein H0V18_19590 [Pyrinomonadaceae bacterium]|nr:hypothetical protein [Pyrinomonadaceae bacterium]
MLLKILYSFFIIPLGCETHAEEIYFLWKAQGRHRTSELTSAAITFNLRFNQSS